MSPLKVVILYEDATVGGLHSVLRTMISVARSAHQRPPFSLFKAVPMKGNAALIKACADFATIRFHLPYKADHVFAVIDGWEVEKVVPTAPPPVVAPTQRTVAFEQYCRDLDDAVRGYMYQQALGQLSPAQQQQERARFHPHVLLWEIESILLAGAAALQARGLQFSAAQTTEEGIRYERHPTRVVERAWRAARRQPYSKSTTGPGLFGDLCGAEGEWPTILERLPSFAALVYELVSL